MARPGFARQEGCPGARLSRETLGMPGFRPPTLDRRLHCPIPQLCLRTADRRFRRRVDPPRVRER
eukprot:2981169-Alexandrium_andersonii.AAC.1